MRRQGALAVIALLAFALGAWLRIRDLAVAGALGDAVGPWWVAASPGWRPHAPIFGWGLALPHKLLLPWVGSLWQAVGTLLVVQALVAPLAVLLVARLGGSLSGALVAGLVAATDPGLLASASSGTRGYLAPMWLGAAALATTLGPRGALLAPAALAMAVMNHPYAACAAPLLLLAPWRRPHGWLGAGLGLLLLVPSLLAWRGLPATGGVETGPGAALLAFLDQGPGAALLAAGPLAALCSRRTRPLGLAALASLGLMVALGARLHYLRDYHLGILAVPALAGLAAPRGAWPLLAAALLRWPDGHDPREATRPGTLGLETLLVRAIAELPAERLVVDGAWVSASPAAEPGALLLDLWLRGRPRAAIGPGGTVVVVVSAEREDLASLPWAGPRLAAGDRHFLAVGDEEAIRAFSERLCAWAAEHDRPPPRLGGAWDGLVAIEPGTVLEDTRRWWACDPAVP